MKENKDLLTPKLDLINNDLFKLFSHTSLNIFHLFI